MDSMKLDVTKSVQRRDGRPARIICTNMKGPWTIVALVVPDSKNNEEICSIYFPNGRVSMLELSCYDLVNVKVKKWLWIYRFSRDRYLTQKHYSSLAEVCDVLHLSANEIDGRLLESEILE